MSENKMKTGKDVHITGRKNGNGWQTFQGVVDGRKTSVDVLSSDVEKMDDRSLETFVKRSLRTALEHKEK